MSNDDFSLVDQAVLGYTNGHRLLAASTDLSASDTYELAAASDLAPGVYLSGDQSYLTGLMLPDSKYYALVRTWAAPEMPRPGCVWSHALLLSRPVLSGQIDLSVLNALFDRPGNGDGIDSFRMRLRVGKRARGQQAEKRVVDLVLSSTYDRKPLETGQTARSELEDAIFAVWSQQWPRLRAKFTFRSIVASSELKGQTLSLTKAPTKPQGIKLAWIGAASDDALSGSITPLRRFLWRYGKDFEPTAEIFPYLVDLYLKTRAPRLDLEVATAILGLDGERAETLKSDILGLLPNDAAVLPSLNQADLARLSAGEPSVLANQDPAVIAEAFGRTGQNEWCDVAAQLPAVSDRAPALAKTIEKAILPLATGPNLADLRTPTWLVMAALVRDPSLAGYDSLRRLSSQENLILLGGKANKTARSIIADVLVERPYIDDFALAPDPIRTEVFCTAVKAFAGARLHSGWIAHFRTVASDCLSALAGLEPRLHLAGVTMLDFPIGPSSDIAHVQLLVEAPKQTDQGARSRLQTYLLELCLRHGLRRQETVLARFLPSLRQTILRAELPLEAQQQLSRFLPEINDYWDLNRRLLKLIRKEYKAGASLDLLVAALELSDAEYAYATNQRPEGMVRKIIRALSSW